MSQRLSFGAGSIAELRGAIASAQARSILLVTGRQSYHDSGAERALAPLLAGLEVERFAEIHGSPTLPDVERGVRAWRARQPDLVVAVGGGSVIDMAKAINLLAAQDATPAVVLAHPATPLRRGRALIAVPTTAGTGSEATHFATIYVDGIKRSLAHEHLRPDHAIVDPGLSDSMPRHLTAATGLDALSQAIESYWAIGATSASQVLAAEAIRLMWPALLPAATRPTPAARAAMAQGAHLAGRAIDVSKTTAAHAVSYPLTARHGVPHGHAVALTLGRFIEHNAAATELTATDPRGAAHVRRTVAQLCGLLGCATPGAAAQAWYALLTSLGLAADLAAVGVKHTDIERLLDEANAERLSNNPVRVTRAALADLLGGLTGA